MPLGLRADTTPRNTPNNRANTCAVITNSSVADSFSKMDDKAVAKIIGKKLVRAAYYFIAAKDGSWYIDLAQCAQAAKEHYSGQQHDIELAYLFARGKLTSKADAIELYQRLSGKINEVASEAFKLNSV